jgi:CrcB protein
MSVVAVVGIALAGSIGAPARYLLDGFVQDRSVGSFPWGTFVVNISGSFVLGVISAMAVRHGFSGAPRLWLATGLCGAFTTFSTFSWETVRLLAEVEWRQAAVNVGASVVVGVAAAAAGMSAVYLVGG